MPVEKVVEVEKLVGMREEDVEQLKRSIQTEAEAERLKIIRQKEQLVAARAKQETALQSEVERHKTEQSERERIKAELDSLESKVMHGGEHVRDRVAKRQAQIAEQQRMLEDRKAEEVCNCQSNNATARRQPSPPRFPLSRLSLSGEAAAAQGG